MVSADRPSRLNLACGVIAVILVTFLVAVACSSSSQPPAGSATKGASATAPASDPPSPSPTPTATPLGAAGTFQVGQRQMPFTEPGHSGPAGQYVKTRHLATVVEYPLAHGASGSQQPAPGPLPIIMFAPGYQLCADSYQPLLQSWASAGYVVAAVNFPRTNCQLKTSADEADLVNQPADVSYALKALLAVSAHPGDLFSGLLNQNEVAAAGHSDGGDTVAAMAANTCCTEPLLKAVAVLSGAVWVPMPGKYFTQATPPMLFVQGSADAINPPWASVQLYRWDAGTRFYLNLVGADHLQPYTTANPAEQVVARTTLAFFDRYVLGQVSEQATMTQDGNVPGSAELDSGGHVPHGAGLPA